MSPGAHLVVMLLTPLAPFLLALALMSAPGSLLLQRAAVLAPVPALVSALMMPAGTGATLPWLLEGSELGLDSIGRVFLFFSAAIWLAAALSTETFVAAGTRGRFLVFFLLAMSGNLGAVVAQDMLAFYLCFSLMSFAAYGLVVHEGGLDARRAGGWYLGLVVAGDMMLYAALVPAALDAGGTVLLADVRETIVDSPHHDMIVALVFAGFGVKAGALGLHVALPMLYRVTPVPAGAAFAGAMLHAGLLGWLRFLPIGGEAPGWGKALLVAGLAGAFYAALVGAVQRDSRAVLAYSSISQMGIMLGGVGAALLAPQHAAGVAAAVAVYALHHAFVKSTLFLGSGLADREPRSRLASIALCVGLLLPVLALPGVPLTSGAVAKELLKEGLTAADAAPAVLLGALLPWTAVATTLVAARFLWLVWPREAWAYARTGATWDHAKTRAMRTHPKTSPVGDRASTAPADVHASTARADIHASKAPADVDASKAPARTAWAAFASLLLLALLAAWWQPIARPPELWSVPVLWELTWPPLLGAALAWLAARAAAGGKLSTPKLPPGDVAVPIERALREAAAGWRRVASGQLPRARNAIRDASTAALADRRWSASLGAIERVLARWGTATAGFVALSIVLALLLLLASGADRGN